MIEGKHTATSTTTTVDADNSPTTPRSSFWHDAIPMEATNAEYIDSVIARQMSLLSTQDRESAYLDVHGVSADCVEETPERIQRGLEQMDAEIKRLEHKEAFDFAESMDPSYTQNPEFRLSFLRTELFDSKKAALRIVRHFDIKLDLFGIDKLVMDITQDDLSKEDMESLYSGNGRVLDFRDRSGRIIHFSMAPRAPIGPDSATTSTLRRAFYNGMITASDPAAVSHGVVLVACFLGDEVPTNNTASDLYWKLPKLSLGLPIRNVAMHLCFDNDQWQPVSALIKTSLNLYSRVRIRTHREPGSILKCLEGLRGHGIEPDHLPVNQDGELVNVDSFRKKMIDIRRKERLSHPLRSTIYVPSPDDVLFGKGTPVQTHAGNRRLRAMVANYQKEYEKGKNGGKANIAQEIVEAVYRSSGMFLRPDGDAWIIVDNDGARNKVSNAFRSLRMEQRKLADAKKYLKRETGLFH